MKAHRLIGLMIIAIAFIVPNAHAIPDLQLDIAGGTWINGTTYSAGDVFTLQAYLLADPAHDNLIADTYFISAAVVPGIARNPAPSLGSFTFAGSSVNVTGGMTYGTPPLDSFYPNLPQHSIFPTYYKEFSFQFNSLNTVATYNVQDNTSGPGWMYIAEFAVNTTALTDGYFIHFDLYNENVITRRRGSNPDTLFAPFSHDAESNGHKVTEPGTLALLGLGLVGIGIFRRRK